MAIISCTRKWLTPSLVTLGVLLTVALPQATSTVLWFETTKEDPSGIYVAGLTPEDRLKYYKNHSASATWATLPFGMTVEDFIALAEMPHLENLYVGQQDFTDDMLVALSHSKSIRTLTVSSANISKAGMSKCARFEKLTNLTMNGGVRQDGSFDLSVFPKVSQFSRPMGRGSTDVLDLMPLKHVLTSLDVTGGTLANQGSFSELKELRNLRLWFPKLDSDGERCIGDMTELRSIVLCGSGITDAFFESISRLTHLESLEISNCNISAHALRELSKIRSLKKLTIAARFIDKVDFTDKDLSATLSELPLLEEFSLSIHRPLMEKISFAANTQLRKLIVSIGSEEAVQGISELGNLRELTIFNLDPKWWGYLSKMSKLEKLPISIPRTGADSIALALRHLKNLKRCEFRGTDLSDAGLESVGQMTGLTELFLDGTKVTSKGLRHLSGLQQLERLHLKNVDITDEGIAALQPLKSLQKLYLEGTKTSDDGAAKLGNFTRLEELSLSGCSITDTSLRSIGKLSSLKMLFLEDTPITDNGLKALSNLKNLEVLALDHTLVQGPGLKYVARLPNINNIGLSGSKITNEGVANLAGSQITCLDLRNTAVTEESMPVLKRLARLKHLDLRNPGGPTIRPHPGRNQ